MNSTTACPTACSLAGPYLNGFWAWIPQTAMNDIFPFTGATSTATLVTIIDSDRAHTTTSVQYPGNYTPAVNSAGTRTQVVSYENDNSPPEWVTETVYVYPYNNYHLFQTCRYVLWFSAHLADLNHSTYPSAFGAWPSTYIWNGYSSLDSPTPTCTSGRWTETVSGNPQPTDPSEWTPLMAVAGNDFSDDPEGESYVLGTVLIGYWQWATMSALWPDQPPLTTCIDSDIGPNWAAFTSTSWYTATSTKYTSTTSSPLPSSEDTSSPLIAATTPPRVVTTSSRLPTAPASTVSDLARCILILKSNQILFLTSSLSRYRIPKIKTAPA